MDDIKALETELAWALFEEQITNDEFAESIKHIEQLKSINKNITTQKDEK